MIEFVSKEETEFPITAEVGVASKEEKEGTVTFKRHAVYIDSLTAEPATSATLADSVTVTAAVLTKDNTPAPPSDDATSITWTLTGDGSDQFGVFADDEASDPLTAPTQIDEKGQVAVVVKATGSSPQAGSFRVTGEVGADDKHKKGIVLVFSEGEGSGEEKPPGDPPGGDVRIASLVCKSDCVAGSATDMAKVTATVANARESDQVSWTLTGDIGATFDSGGDKIDTEIGEDGTASVQIKSGDDAKSGVVQVEAAIKDKEDTKKSVNVNLAVHRVKAVGYKASGPEADATTSEIEATVVINDGGGGTDAPENTVVYWKVLRTDPSDQEVEVSFSPGSDNDSSAVGAGGDGKAPITVKLADEADATVTVGACPLEWIEKTEKEEDETKFSCPCEVSATHDVVFTKKSGGE